MQISTNKVLLGCIFFGCTSFLNASSNLGELTVTTAGLGQEQSIEDVQASIEVIDQNAINSTSTLSVPQVINQALGVNVNDAGSTSSVSIRGFDSSHTLILVDGLRISGKYGSADLTSISLENIERIEIVKGPMSALYGADAVAGVVNIITKNLTKDTVQASIFAGQAQNGQRDTFITKLNLTKVYDNTTHSFGVELREKDDYRYEKSSVHTDLKNESRQFVNYGNKIIFNDNNTLSTKLEFANQDDDGINSSNYTTYEKEKRYRASLLHNYSADTYLVDTNFGYAQSDTDVDRGTGLEITKYKQAELNTYLRHFTSDSALNIFGAGLKNDDIDVSIYSKEATRFSYDFLYQNDYQITEDLSSSVGLRYDHFDDFGSSTTPKASLIYNYNDFKFRTSYGEAFKAPSFTYMYSHFTRSSGPVTYDISGNENLKPEESKTFEYAVDYKKDDLSLSLIHHRTKLENLIQSYTSSYVFPINYTNYKNVAKSSINGTEISINYKFHSDLSANLGWEYLDTNDEATGDRLTGSAKTTAKLNIAYQFDKFHFYLNVKKYNDFYASNSSRVNVNSDYTVADVKIDYNISDTINLFFGVDNLQNKTMPYNMRSLGTPNDPAERYYYTGIKFSL